MLALEWLTNELSACETKYLTDVATLGPNAHAVMNRWLNESMLADVRGDKIAELPADEQSAWKSLWAKLVAIQDQTSPMPRPAK
jgi:hypothetical protein